MSTRSQVTTKWIFITLAGVLALYIVFAKTTFMAHLVPSQYDTLATFPATTNRPAVDLMQDTYSGKCYYVAIDAQNETLAEEVPCPI